MARGMAGTPCDFCADPAAQCSALAAEREMRKKAEKERDETQLLADGITEGSAEWEDDAKKYKRECDEANEKLAHLRREVGVFVHIAGPSGEMPRTLVFGREETGALPEAEKVIETWEQAAQQLEQRTDEALKRAEAYRRAGADAILIHSKRATADEIFAFCKEWANRAPVVIVPTMYYATPTDRFRAAGISCVIWANHNLRAAITAMREVSRKIAASESLTGVEGTVASVKDVFALAGNTELAEAERRYLPQPGEDTGAIVLAASRGAALGELTVDRPKCMIDVRGQPLLRRLVSTLKDSGIRDVSVVVGYRKEAVDVPSVELLANDVYAATGECASLAAAEKRLKGPCLVTYGDILFRRYLLDRLLEAEGDIVVVADALWRERRRAGPGMVHDHIACSHPFSPGYLDDDTVDLRRIGPDLADGDIHGEWVGLVKLSDAGSALVRKELQAMKTEGKLDKANMPDLFNRLVAAGHRVRVQYITGHWLDVDDAFDLARARNFL